MRPRLWIINGLTAVALAAPPAAGQEAGADVLQLSVLLRDDSQYTGPALISEEGKLRLEVDPYDAPATLDLEAVTSLVVTPEGLRLPLIPEMGRDLLTLKRRQKLRGRVLSVEDGFARFESTRLGVFKVPLGQCGDLLPPALADTDGPARPLWGPWMDRNEGASDVQTDGEALRLSAQGARATRRCLDYGDRLLLELSWEGEPEFRIHLGGDHRRDPVGGVVVEPWDGELVLYSFDGTDLDLVETGLELGDDSSVVLQFEIDGERVRLANAEVPSGRVLAIGAELDRPDQRDMVLITRLAEPMLVLRAEVGLAAEAEPGRIAVEQTVMLDRVLGFDSEARTFTLKAARGGGLAGTVSFDQSLGIRFAVGRDREALDAAEPEADWYRVTCRDGESIEGRDLCLVPGGLRFLPRWAEAPVVLPLDELWHFRQRSSNGDGAAPSASLELEGQAAVNVKLVGFEMVEGRPQPTLQVFGFKEPIAVPPGVPFSLTRRSAEGLVADRAFPNIIVLDDGQRFPALVLGADRETVTFRTPLQQGEVQLQQARIKAVLLGPGPFMNRSMKLTQHPFYKAAALEGEAMDLSLKPSRMTRNGDALRLSWALAVPRSESASPGEQLFLARNGDLLRANLEGLENAKARLAGGASAGIVVPVQRLAGWVRVDREPKLGASVAEGAWQFILGPQGRSGGPWVGGAVLHGVAQRSEGDRLILEHADLGSLSFPTAQVRRVDHAARARRALLPFDSWRSRPMRNPDAEGLLIEDR